VLFTLHEISRNLQLLFSRVWLVFVQKHAVTSVLVAEQVKAHHNHTRAKPYNVCKLGHVRFGIILIGNPWPMIDVNKVNGGSAQVPADAHQPNYMYLSAL
jgi:hypothetical protein